jgi:hypothetical protein
MTGRELEERSRPVVVRSRPFTSSRRRSASQEASTGRLRIRDLADEVGMACAADGSDICDAPERRGPTTRVPRAGSETLPRMKESEGHSASSRF